MRKLLISMLFVMLAISVPVVHADDFSFTGNFTVDNDVQFFTFNVGAPSTVTLLTYSYAGGTNSAGQVIPSGGFDPILALFDSSGNLIDQNDDGGVGLVPQDPVTGAYYDTYLSAMLNAGDYLVSVMQYNNFANGPTLSDGFIQDGVANQNFTRLLVGEPSGYFWDVTDHERNSDWAFDILNVNQASEVPEPSTFLLLGAGLAGVGLLRKKFKTN